MEEAGRGEWRKQGAEAGERAREQPENNSLCQVRTPNAGSIYGETNVSNMFGITHV